MYAKEINSVPNLEVLIYMALPDASYPDRRRPMAEVEQICGKFCDDVGLCVSIDKTTYVYSGGKERGFIVRLINYGRFPTDHRSLQALAETLAAMLQQDLQQESYTIIGYDDNGEKVSTYYATPEKGK